LVTLGVPTVVVEGQMFGAGTVNASPDILNLFTACLPRPRLLQISDFSEHNCGGEKALFGGENVKYGGEK
jgi:hypothetical protein